MKKILSIVMLFAAAASAAAMPARREGVVRTASDGTEKTVYLHGDAFYHYMTDGEGNWLDEKTLMPLSAEARAARQEHGEARIAARRRVQQAQMETGTSRLLAPRGVVILVSYKDTPFSSTNADMTEWAMGEDYRYNGATGSIHQYFYDQSWGQYDMQIDVVGPVTVSKNASYYGNNVTDYWGNSGDEHADELVVEACRLADAQGVDFSKYDSNNDGKVDWVVILYAGKGEADGGEASTIWPHQYDLSYTNMDFKLDGKTIDHYCCLNEIEGRTGARCGIGTFCHEFSHVMGLPDFYSTQQNSTHKTLGAWDIMDYGPYNNNGNTPPNYSAYERWFMGWIEPTLVSSASTVTLPLLQETGAAAVITKTGKAISNILAPNPSVFYLFENREKSGWDKYIPGKGMLITKVSWDRNKWLNNTVNNTASAMGVDIIEADGRAAYYDYQGKARDAFPAGATSFTTSFTTSSRLLVEPYVNHEITNIRLLNGVITFDVDGGEQQGIEATPSDSPTRGEKILRDGKLYIMYKGTMYDVQGRRI